MDCPNCNFINMPGLKTCGSCGGRLTFDDVDIVPPRARDAVLPLQVRSSINRARLSIRDEARLSAARIREVINSAAPPAAIVAALFPGGGHFLLRQRRAGSIFFLLWLAGAIGVVYMLGTSMLLPFAFMVGVHCLSISQLLSRRLADLSIGKRILIGFLISAALNVIIYTPLYRAIQNLVVSIELTGIAAGPTFLSGDVIWIEGRSLQSPIRRGDLVLRTVHQPRDDFRYGIVVRDGVVADRVIAIPGDNVSFDNQLITVNGEALTPGRYPVVPVTLGSREFQLEKDEYIIVPSALSITGQAHLAAPVLSKLSLTKREEILGRVICRVRPLDRMEIFPRSKDISPPPRDPSVHHDEQIPAAPAPEPHQ